jgi:formylglycine-generating enzyme required for sulfatase activity
MKKYGILFVIIIFCAVRSFLLTANSAAAEEIDTRWLLEMEPDSPKGKAPEGFVFVKGGCYQMGDTFGDGESNEKPVHEVCIDDFYMGETEVTQRQWTEIMGPAPAGSKQGSNPSYFKGCDDCPVEQVSWNDAQEFIKKLNQRTTPLVPLNKGGLRGLYRLPTEAEWEYAARSGGKREKYAGGDDLDSVGWYSGNSEGKTYPVKQKRPNGLGLYDMSGNVWEWCQDWYDSGYYKNSPKDNPKGASSGAYRVLRGGSWGDLAWRSRAADRSWSHPDARVSDLGFRCVMTK